MDLHAHVPKALIERTGLDAHEIDDVISGAVGRVGEQSGNTARWAVLGAGFPESVPAVTVDRQCGSSRQALHFAAQGVESMSHLPIGSQSLGGDFLGTKVGERYQPSLVRRGSAPS